MEQKSIFKCSLLTFIIVVELQVLSGCLEKERLGLLDLKAFFSSHFQKSYDPLPSWNGDDCCNWERVICNNLTTGDHVVELLLNQLLGPNMKTLKYQLNDTLYTDYFLYSNNSLNLSLFRPFEQLKNLDLFYNSLSKVVEDKGLGEFQSLKRLESLHLGLNNLDNGIFSSLSGLISLKKLILNHNSLQGSIPSHDIAKLKSLEILDLRSNQYFDGAIPLQDLRKLRELSLSGNNFNGTLPIQGFDRSSSLEILNLNVNYLKDDIFPSLSMLTSLKTLMLARNLLKGTIPRHEIIKLRSLEILELGDNRFSDGAIPLKDLKNLTSLSLRNNSFRGAIPIQGFCETNNLVELVISRNGLTGKFPECVWNFTRLKLLDISWNHFSGEIPSTAISNLTSIVLLSFGGNSFEGTFSLSSLANLTELKYFLISERGDSKLHVETEKPHWKPSFQLDTLTLRNCNLNRQTSSSKIPSFLSSQHDLRSIDLAHNQLLGTFPLWLLNNNSNLFFLVLNDNSLTGTFQLPAWEQQLNYLHISGNNFTGQLPDNVGFLLPGVIHFNISRNHFEGQLPSSMEQMIQLDMLDLSNNKFSGNLQVSMFDGMAFLICLFLANNNFSGSIQQGSNNFQELVALDISNNMLSGEIPSWIVSLENLQYLQLSKNRFLGELPIEICSLHRLAFLDISQNQLLGTLPSCFDSSSLVYLYLRDNQLSGPIPKTLSSGSQLKVLDLSYNNFSGRIPNWLNNLTRLRVLLFKGNRLQGAIPQQLCQVREMSILDLSSNQLSGSIPLCLTNISFGMVNGTEYSTIQKSKDYIVFGLTFQSLTLYAARDLYTPEIVYSPPGAFIDPEGQAEVDFTTKSRSDTYKGNILNYMSGLDLSHNELTGQIPLEIGGLLKIHALNFSRNRLVGFIPKTISNLKQLESLDLSYNSLSGSIPSQLGELNSLAIFNVSYNNLSGTLPTSPHFQTYPASSYFGNHHLCGPFIEKKCSSSMLPPNIPSLDEEEDKTIVDLEAFYWSFAASYITVLLGFAIVLYINPQWREAWYYFVHVRCPYVCKYI